MKKDLIKEYMAQIGRKGGQSKSNKKQLAFAENRKKRHMKPLPNNTDMLE